MNDTFHSEPLPAATREALEMGCEVTVQVGELAITYTPPDTQIMEFSFDTELELPGEFPDDDEPEPVMVETDWSGTHENEDGNMICSVSAKFSGCAVETEGSAMATLVLTYAESKTADMVTQLLGLLEDITDRGHEAGVLPVGFEGLLRGIVNEYDEADAEDAQG